jgi:hypothetical protein
MKNRRYRVELEHDNGVVQIETVADDARTAVSIVLEAEKAPRGAVNKVETAVGAAYAPIWITLDSWTWE